MSIVGGWSDLAAAAALVFPTRVGVRVGVVLAVASESVDWAESLTCRWEFKRKGVFLW